MNKQIHWYAAITLVSLLALACKNSATDKTAAAGDAANTALPESRTDSLVGFKGCERAGFKALSAQAHEFKYQHYTFTITQREEPGDIIEVLIDSSGTKLKIPAVEATFFSGVWRDHFFVDIGTGPDTREVIVYSLGKGVLSQVYRAPYLLHEPPFVANGSFQYYHPVEESAVTNMPNCPDREAWEKKGLRVGFGQRYMYHMANRGLTRKSEFVCAPLQ